MGTKVILAPAGAGKTSWAIQHTKELASNLNDSPRVVVPTGLQAREFQRRLAQAGGAIGVKVKTFGEISGEILTLAEVYATRISETTQGRLLLEIVDQSELVYFAGIKTTPGFIQVALEFIRELKSGGIKPVQFAAAVKGIKGGPRLVELALIYSSYQKELQKRKWTDSVGETWMAAEELEANPGLCSSWNSLIIDGFDDFSPIQLRMVQSFGKQIPELIITLTGEDDGSIRPLVHKRFNRTLSLLSDTLSFDTILLNGNDQKIDDQYPVSRLERILFRMEEEVIPGDGLIRMIAVPDREAEVRAALRWIKSLILKKGIKPGQAALLMRNLEPYRAIIPRIAIEYGIPVQIQGGFALSENPAVAGLLGLLKVMQPGKSNLNWRGVVEAWRSPYFGWEIKGVGDGHQISFDNQLEDADKLGRISRWGSVIQGYQQWEEAFSLLKKGGLVDEEYSKETPSPPDEIASDSGISSLWIKFQAFVQNFTPPTGDNFIREYVSWVEDILGVGQDQNFHSGIGVIQKIFLGPPDLAQRDLEAIRILQKIFREFVWAENALNGKRVSFNQFLESLESIIRRSSYHPQENELGAVFCADITEARGIPFKAVVVFGLGEGEFPQTIKEDPFLRDVDRMRLQAEYGLPLRQSTDSAEAEYFYEAITRARSELLLTRPRIADNGAPWQPSPFWEEILRCVNIEPVLYTSRSLPPLDEAASEAEFFEIISTSENKSAWGWASLKYPEICSQILQAQKILISRVFKSDRSGNLYNGGLRDLNSVFASRNPANQVWSASRLETYQTCPYYYFLSRVLGLEKMNPPQDGLDARQLGNIYHHILENLYQEAVKKPDLQKLQQALPGVAELVFEQAPRKEGFRKTAWWIYTQEEIISNLQQSLIVLETLDPEYKFYKAEQSFGIKNSPEPALRIKTSQGEFFLRGFIDRVDKNKTGALRIIDYKTSAPFGFTNQAVREGKKLQLPLYALAAERALNLGKIGEGFYFHVRSAQPSGFKLSSFRINRKKGPEAAIEIAVEKSWAAVQAIREGAYQPVAPENGCPEYCPGADFCWQYRAQRW